jgi:uncharacterized membrane protein
MTLKRAVIEARVRAYLVPAFFVAVIVTGAIKFASNPETSKWAWVFLVFCALLGAACSVPYVMIYRQLRDLRRQR